MPSDEIVAKRASLFNPKIDSRNYAQKHSVVIIVILHYLGAFVMSRGALKFMYEMLEIATVKLQCDTPSDLAVQTIYFSPLLYSIPDVLLC